MVIFIKGAIQNIRKYLRKTGIPFTSATVLGDNGVNVHCIELVSNKTLPVLHAVNDAQETKLDTATEY